MTLELVAPAKLNLVLEVTGGVPTATTTSRP